MAHMTKQWLKRVERYRSYHPIAVKMKVTGPDDGAWDKEHRIQATVALQHGLDEQYIYLTMKDIESLVASLVQQLDTNDQFLSLLQRLVDARVRRKKRRTKRSRPGPAPPPRAAEVIHAGESSTGSSP
jgi:hypothetical protein